MPRCPNAHGDLYRALRAAVVDRYDSTCVFCGRTGGALETHHWSLRYPCGATQCGCGRRKVEERDLVLLCQRDHDLVTDWRKARKRGLSWREFLAGEHERIREATRQILAAGEHHPTSMPAQPERERAATAEVDHQPAPAPAVASRERTHPARVDHRPMPVPAAHRRQRS